MKFKTDENLPVEAATALRDAGFDAETVWDEALAGSDDATIAERVRREGRILITLDLDFANIRAYPPDEQCRPHRASAQAAGQSKCCCGDEKGHARIEPSKSRW
ncbi:MAG: DUF5615 family PIN-like protein [Bryobacteraceae bacterium]